MPFGLWARRNHVLDGVPEVLRDISMATIFWLSIYGVHICATWRIRLNRPCVAAMWPYVKLLSPLVIMVALRNRADHYIFILFLLSSFFFFFLA